MRKVLIALVTLLPFHVIQADDSLDRIKVEILSIKVCDSKLDASTKMKAILRFPDAGREGTLRKSWYSSAQFHWSDLTNSTEKKVNPETLKSWNTAKIQHRKFDEDGAAHVSFHLEWNEADSNWGWEDVDFGAKINFLSMKVGHTKVESYYITDGRYKNTQIEVQYTRLN